MILCFQHILTDYFLTLMFSSQFLNQFLGASYNIPVCIWLVNTHPFNPPICYVKPTADMQIKISRYVDYNGKIYLPYLHDWTPVSNYQS